MKSREELIFIRAVGARIKLLREKKGMSQEYLAYDAHVTQSTVSAYETGARAQSIYILYRFAKSLGCNVKDFLYLPN